MALTESQKVELYAGIKDESPAIFTADELAEFLDRADDEVLLAASYAALALSGKHALIAYKLETGEWAKDGTKTAEAWRKLSDTLLKQYEDAPAFATAERTVSIFSAEHILVNRIARETT